MTDTLFNRSPTGSASQTVGSQLARLIAEIHSAYPVLTDPFDPDWRSPCEVAPPQRPATALQPGLTSDETCAVDLEIPWRPLARPPSAVVNLFSPVERALEVSVHPDIKAYYGSYYSGGLEADSPEGPVSLLQLWNDEDASRLMENLLGHALAQTRAKTPFSVFFALTEVDSEMFLSVENHTGHVLLERPGHRPERTVANSLSEFLKGLHPAPPERHPERAAFLRAQGVN